MNSTKNSSTSKEQVEVLSKSSDLLFENDFRDHVVDSSKAKRKSSHEKSRWWRNPFRKALHISNISSQTQDKVVTINRTVRRMEYRKKKAF